MVESIDDRWDVLWRAYIEVQSANVRHKSHILSIIEMKEQIQHELWFALGTR